MGGQFRFLEDVPPELSQGRQTRAPLRVEAGLHLEIPAADRREVVVSAAEFEAILTPS